MRSEKQKEGLSVFRQGWDCSEGSEVPQNLRRSSFSGWYRCRVCTGEKHLLKYYALSTSLTSPQFSSTLLPFSSTTVKPDRSCGRKTRLPASVGQGCKRFQCRGRRGRQTETGSPGFRKAATTAKVSVTWCVELHMG